MTFQAYLDRYLPLLEKELKATLAVPDDVLAPFYGMMGYHMGWVDAQLDDTYAPQGKRLRPVFCLLTCEAVGGQMEQALPAATAVELLHNFSLIHDDIEDNSSTRRHRTTLWRVWGLPHGINCGDALFAISFRTMDTLRERGVTAEIVLNAQRMFADTCILLTEGQYMDMIFEKQMDIEVDDYLRMVRNKTAVLIACSMHLGALIGGADEGTRSKYAYFGENLGMAFQVVDDILGIWGQESKTGKSASSDILTRKKTLPVVYALGNAELRAIYEQDDLHEHDAVRAVQILDELGARQYAEWVAQDYAEKAMACLDDVDRGSPAHRAIHDLGRWLLQRDH
ncbi:MAG: polyprenyl synthetase family protein [Anaerolineae bacterium]|nr:polyprenyl synthetase family protein [Anaerolineae bacterium]